MKRIRGKLEMKRRQCGWRGRALSDVEPQTQGTSPRPEVRRRQRAYSPLDFSEKVNLGNTWLN